MSTASLAAGLSQVDPALLATGGFMIAVGIVVGIVALVQLFKK